MKCDPKFATSPNFVNDKYYEFSIDPELITLVESDPFHGYDTKTVVAHLTKLNALATLFSHDDFFACNDRDDLKKLLCKRKEKSLNARMQYDPKFATSPNFVTDKDYEFSVDPELISLV